MNRSFRILAVLGLAFFGSLAQAQGFPNKSITLIVPWPPGGSSDLHVRAFAETASRHLGQPIIVEDRPGAGGTLGPVIMAQTAKADGYTLSQFPISMLRYPHMQKLAVHPIKDFTYVINPTSAAAHLRR